MRTVAVTLMAVMAATQCAAEEALVHARNVQELKQALLEVAQKHLHPRGFTVDPRSAWLHLSADLPDTDEFTVSFEQSGSSTPALPLSFELRAIGVGTEPLQAKVGVFLTRETWTAGRRLRRGSIVDCNDLRLEQRDVRRLSQHAMSGACDIGAGSIALHDLAAGDVVRIDDVGPAPEVMADSAVQVSATANGIEVIAMATALADGREGDRIEVKLYRPLRILNARVVGPGRVQVAEATR